MHIIMLDVGGPLSVPLELPELHNTFTKQSKPYYIITWKKQLS